MKLMLAVSVLIVSFSFSDLFAEAFFAGNVKSVNSDSGFNAQRNPALMSGQKRDTLGFSLFYMYNTYNDTSGLLSMGPIELNVDGSAKEKINGSFSFSYVKKLQEGSFGFAVKNAEGTDQILINKSTLEISTAAGSVSTEKNEKKSFAASTLFSYSRDLGRNESAGIQLEIGTSTENKKKSKHEISPLKDYKVEITTDQLIGNLNCGYSYVTNKYEIGAILKFGEYIYEKGKYRYNNNLTPFDKNEKEISPYIYRNKGFEYTLGLGYNLTRKLLFEIESTLAIPLDVKKKELKDDDDGVLAEKHETSHINFSGGANAGLNYKYNSNLKLGFGGGTAVYRSESTGSGGIKFGKGNLNVYSVLAGAEIKPTEEVSLLFGLNSYYMKQSMKLEMGLLSMKIDIDALYFNVFAGASTSY